MKLPLIAIAFFIALGLNTKSIAQARYASANVTEAATHGSTTGANNYDTYTSKPVATSVKETTVESSHSAPPSNGSPAAPPANNRLGGALTTGIPGGPSSGPAAVISASIRYNPVTKHTYPYHTTPTSKYKSEHRQNFARERFHPYSHFFFCPDFFLAYECELAYDEMMMADNDNVPKGSSVLNTSLDGYVVYSRDTLPGIVTITDKNIYLEQAVDGRHVQAYTFPKGDANVKAVAVFEGNNSLYLGRASDGGKLSRVIHSGKLSVYDDKYNFFTPENVHRGKMTLAYGGQIKSPKSFLAADSKQLLIESINSAYGLQLDAKDFSWDQLLNYLDKLD